MPDYSYAYLVIHMTVHVLSVSLSLSLPPSLPPSPPPPPLFSLPLASLVTLLFGLFSRTPLIGQYRLII